MAKKITESVSLENLPEVQNKSTEGLYVYLGPTIRGAVANGAIYKGIKSEILKNIPAVPQIERLLVIDTAVAKSRAQLASEQGGITAAFKAVSAFLADKKEV